MRVRGSNTGSECEGDREQHGEGEGMREKTRRECEGEGVTVKTGRACKGVREKHREGLMVRV